MSRALVPLIALTGCPTETSTDTHTHEHAPSAFSLRFAATADGQTVGCGAAVTGLGPAGAHAIGVSDLRFYVSNLVFRDADGNPIQAAFDEDEFQYTGDTGWVALVDLTSDAGGDCADGAIAFSEGTARTHDAITGTTLVDDVASVSFDVGLPQALMQEVIANNTAEGAPSPLGEMYWSWAMGYRFLVFNLTVSDGMESGEGYVHVGSTGCGPMGENALESQDTCDQLNTPAVALASFDLANDTVAVDLPALLEGLPFVAPVYDPETYEVIGEQVGAACHSSPDQPDCPLVFGNLGVDIATGASDAAANTVFGVAAR